MEEAVKAFKKKYSNMGGQKVSFTVITPLQAYNDELDKGKKRCWIMQKIIK